MWTIILTDNASSSLSAAQMSGRNAAWCVDSTAHGLDDPQPADCSGTAVDVQWTKDSFTPDPAQHGTVRYTAPRVATFTPVAVPYSAARHRAADPV